MARQSLNDLLKQNKGTQSFEEVMNQRTSLEDIVPRPRSKVRFNPTNTVSASDQIRERNNMYSDAINMVRQKSAQNKTQEDLDRLPEGAFDYIESNKKDNNLSKVVYNLTKNKRYETINNVAAAAKSNVSELLQDKYKMDKETADYYENNWNTISANKKAADYAKEQKDALSKMDSREYELLKTYSKSMSALKFSTDPKIQQEEIKARQDAREQLISKYGLSENDIEKLADYVSRDTNARYNEKLNREANEMSKTGLGRAALRAEALAVAPAAGITSAVDALTEKLTGRPIDIYSDNKMLSNLQNAAETNVSEAVEERYGETVRFINDVLMSVGESAETMAIGSGVADFLGLAGNTAEMAAKIASYPLFSSGAFAATLRDKIESGQNEDQAFAYAVATGIAEGLFEEFSFDKLQKFAHATGKVGKLQFVKNLLKQGFYEGTEEMNTDIANTITDALINADYSDLVLNKDNYISQGYSEEEASKLATRDFGKQILESGLAGAISGILMGTGAGVVQHHNYKKMGSTATQKTLEKAVDVAMNSDIASESTAREIAQRLSDEGRTVDSLSDTEKTQLFESLGSLQNDEIDNAIDKALNEKLDNPDTIDKAKALFEEYRTSNMSDEEFETKVTNEVAKNSQERNAILSARDEAFSLSEEFTPVTNALNEARTDRQIDMQNKAIEKEIAKQDKKANKQYAKYEGATTSKEKYEAAKGVAAVTVKDGKETKETKVLKINSLVGGANSTLVSEGGNTVMFKNLTFKDENMGKLYNEVVNTMYDKAVANKALENYKGQPVESYVKAYNVVYELGRQAARTNKDANWLLNNALDSYIVTNMGGASIASEVFYQGKNAAENYKKVKETVNGKTENKTYKNKSNAEQIRDTDSEIKDLLAAISEKTGVEIKEINAIKDNDGNYNTALLGSFFDNVITLNIEGKNEVQTLLHEVMEKMKSENQEGYNLIVAEVIDYVQSTKGSEALIDNLTKYQKAYGTVEGYSSTEDIADEYTNDFVAGILTSPEGLKDLAKWASEDDEKKAKNLFEAIEELFNKILDAISTYMDSHKANMNLGTKDGFEATGKRIEALRQTVLNELDKMGQQNADITSNNNEQSKYSLNVNNTLTSTEKDWLYSKLLNYQQYMIREEKYINRGILDKNNTHNPYNFSCEGYIIFYDKTSTSYYYVDYDKDDLPGNFRLKYVIDFMPDIKDVIHPAVFQASLINYEKRANKNVYSISKFIDAYLGLYGIDLREKCSVEVFSSYAPRRYTTFDYGSEGSVRWRTDSDNRISRIRKRDNGKKRSSFAKEVPLNNKTTNKAVPKNNVPVDVIDNSLPKAKKVFSVDINDSQRIINESMTMQDAKNMIQRAYNIARIEGYRDAEEWVNEDPEEVALVIENEYSLQQLYLNKIPALMDGDIVVEEIIDAYINKTLTGKVKPKKAAVLDSEFVKKDVVVSDNKFYAPQKIDNAKEVYSIAGQRITKSNEKEVSEARAKILLYAHNKNAADTLGITESELNKKLRSWSNYSAKARDISMRINKNAADANRWTGIENVSWINRHNVTTEEIERMVNKIEGRADQQEKNYIARTMLSFDTHIDWSWLNFNFGTDKEVNKPYEGTSKRVNGYYIDKDRTVTTKLNAPHTVAHEMTHALDHQWGRDFGVGYALTEFVNTVGLEEKYSGDALMFLEEFRDFVESIAASSDIRNEYAGDVKETFARFGSKFVSWANTIATGYNDFETFTYNDKFTQSQYLQFARILQMKAALDNNKVLEGKKSFSVDVSSNDYAPAFYSKMNNEIAAIKTDKIGAASLIPYLKGKGVKEEEIKWSGISSFVEGKKSVTKEELLNFVNENELQIEESTRAMLPEVYEEYIDEFNKLSKEIDFGYSFNSFYDEDYGEFDYNEFNEALDEFDLTDDNDSVYGKQIQRLAVISNYLIGNEKPKYRDYSMVENENYREILFKLPNSSYTNRSMEYHWDERGVLAHARIDDTFIDKNKVLFVEEIQSDWHNEGNRSGYYNETLLADTENLKQQRNKEYNDFSESVRQDTVLNKLTDKFYKNRVSNFTNEWDFVFNKILGNDEIESGYTAFPSHYSKDFNITKAEADTLKKYRDKYKDIEDKYSNIDSSKTYDVPDAPFKNGKYVEYVMKRLLRMAAEDGYDAIGWTTAKMQEERWSDDYAEGYRIEYDQDIPKFMNKYGKQWNTKAEKREVNGNEIWLVNITPEMKQSVLYEGQARFSVEVDSEGNKLSEQQIEFFKDSKGRDQKGNLKVFYHGTRANDLNVFDMSFLGTGSGDTGYFGKGFYFAFTEAEAKFYGRNIIKAYLNTKNPYYFNENLSTYNGKRSSNIGSEAIFAVNFEKQFPDIAKKFVIDAWDKEGNYIPLSFKQFAKEFEDVYNNKVFKVRRESDEYTYEDTFYVTTDEKKMTDIQDNGKVDTWYEYGYEAEFSNEKDASDQAYNAANYLNQTKYWGINIPNAATMIMQSEFAEELKKRGYDSIYQSAKGDEVVVFEPNQIKRIDNKAPTQNVDIRYQVDIDDDLSIFESIIAENEEIAEASNVIKNTVMNLGQLNIKAADIKKIASSIKTEWKSNAKVDDIADSLTSVYNYMNQDNVNYDALVQIMSEIAKPILENVTETNTTRSESWEKFRNYLAATKFSLSPKQVREVVSEYGSVENYRKRLFGVTTVSKEAFPLDEIWEQLVEASGNTLPAVADTNQPSILLQTIDGLRPQAVTQNTYAMNLEEASYDLALEIYRRFFEAQAENKNSAEIAQAIGKVKAKQLQLRRKSVEKYKEKLAEQKKLLAAEKKKNIKKLAEEIQKSDLDLQSALSENDEVAAAIIQDLKNKNEKKLEQVRKQRDDQISRIKAKNFDARKTERERRKNTALKEQLRNQINSLNKMLKSPNTAAFIKPTMVMGTIKVLEAINLDTGKSQGMREKLAKLAELYAAYADDTKTFNFDYDASTAQMIVELRDMFEDRNYTELSNDELQKVVELVIRLKKQIQNASKLLQNEKYNDAAEAAQDVIKEVNESKGSMDNRWTKKFDNYFSYQLNAYRWFRKTSGYKDDGALMNIYEQLDKGQMKMIQMQKEINDMFAPLLEGKENQEHVKRLTSIDEKDMVDIGLKVNGKPVKVTRGMLLSYLMHIQNDDNARHMVIGGFTLPDMKLYKDGKYKEAFEKTTIGEFFTYQDLKDSADGLKANKKDATFEDGITNAIRVLQGRSKKLRKNLSEWELSYLETAEKLFHEYYGEKINEVSVETKGYALAQTKNYFPINTDKKFTRTEFAALKQDGSLEGLGFLKERIKASNPIMLEDIGNVILRQTDNTSRYYGFSIPVRNVNMVMNMKFNNRTSPEAAISDKWGAYNLGLFQKILQDVQTGRGAEDELASFFNRLRGNFAGATLTANIGVAIKQTASYPTAAAVLGRKPLLKAFKNFSFNKDKGIEELEVINPLLWYRSKGQSSADISYAKQSDIYKKLEQKFPMFKAVSVDLIQNMDSATVRTLEYASMYYVDDNFKELEKGSEEYWQKVSDIFTKVVEETQPNYTVLQRPEALKTTNQLAKQLFMFKTQPLQNFGILYDAIGEYSTVKKKYGKDSEEFKKSVEKLSNAIISQLTAAAVFSAMTILANLAYHKHYKYRQDDDKSFVEEVALGFVSGVTSTLASMLLGGDYLYSAISEKLFGTKNYGIEVSIVEMFNDLNTLLNNLQNNSTKLADAKTEAQRAEAWSKLGQNVEDAAVLVGQYFGFPVNNVKNTIGGIYLPIKDLFTGATWGDSDFIWDESVESQYVRLFDALISNDMGRFDKLKSEQIDKLKSDQQKKIDAGKMNADSAKDPEDTIALKMKSMIKESYLNKEITADEAIEYFTRAGINFDAFTIDEWDYKAETGATSYTHYSRLNDAISNAYEKNADRGAIIQEINKLLSNGVKKESISQDITRNYKPIYLKNKSANLKNLLLTCYMACGYTRNEALKKIENWK